MKGFLHFFKHKMRFLVSLENLATWTCVLACSEGRKLGVSSVLRRGVCSTCRGLHH